MGCCNADVEANRKKTWGYNQNEANPSQQNNNQNNNHHNNEYIMQKRNEYYQSEAFHKKTIFKNNE